MKNVGTYFHYVDFGTWKNGSSFLFLVSVLEGDKFLCIKILPGWEVSFLHQEVTNGFFKAWKHILSKLTQHIPTPSPPTYPLLQDPLCRPRGA
jgi:hypothetical protein